MRMRIASFAALASSMICCSISPAAANPYDSVFVRANQERLCEAVPGSSRKVVNKVRLAGLILSRLNVPMEALEWSNKTGDPRPGHAVLPEDRIFALTSAKPFGNQSAMYEKEAGAIFDDTLYLTGFLSTSRGYALSQGYSIPANLVRADEYLLGDAQIECKGAPKEAGKAKGADDPTARLSAAAKEAISVRGSVSDLNLPKARLGDAKYAKVSYTDDMQNDDTKAAIDAALGIKLLDFTDPGLGLGKTTLLSYVYVHTLNTTKKADEQYVEPGLMANSFYGDDFVSAIIAVSGSAVKDYESDSLVSKYKITARPSFNISDDLQLFGGPLPMIGPFAPKTTLEVFASGFHIFDAGTNAEYQSKSGFFSYGATAGIEIIFPTIDLLKGTTLSASYTYADNTNGLVDVRRFDAGVALTPFGSMNWSLNLDYHKGEDANTLKMEHYWLASLGYRY